MRCFTALGILTISIASLVVICDGIPLPPRYPPVRNSGICPTSIESCTCKTLANQVIVSCENFSKRQQLLNALDTLRGYELQQFTMFRSKLTIADEDFSDVKLQNMNVQLSELVVNLTDDSPSGLTSIRSLNLQDSKVGLGLVSRFSTHLTSMSFRRCEFINYNENWFKNLSVPSLTVDESPKIDQPIASGLIDLESYSHTGSNLRYLHRSLLPENAGKLRELVFRDNAIESISKDFLEGLPMFSMSESKLDLRNNRLKTLDEETFKNFNGTLLTSGNELECSPDLLWLKRRILDGSMMVFPRIICFKDRRRFGVEDIPEDISY